MHLCIMTFRFEIKYYIENTKVKKKISSRHDAKLD